MSIKTLENSWKYISWDNFAINQLMQSSRWKNFYEKELNPNIKKFHDFNGHIRNIWGDNS